jgi:hypothetical protein
MGLSQPLPPVHSRQAAEITRRVMHWATLREAPSDDDKELENTHLVS